jgi:DNA invertase Pin-like site-specific DNA recombinase
MYSRDVENAPQPRAVAYYRTTAEHEGSIEDQRQQVRKWAEEHGVEIVREFADEGAPSFSADERPAFTELMDQWVKQDREFRYVLCLAPDRWGRAPVPCECTCGRHA